jgi:hypothetical protein
MNAKFEEFPTRGFSDFFRPAKNCPCSKEGMNVCLVFHAPCSSFVVLLGFVAPSARLFIKFTGTHSTVYQVQALVHVRYMHTEED